MRAGAKHIIIINRFVTCTALQYWIFDKRKIAMLSQFNTIPTYIMYTWISALLIYKM